MAFDVYLPDVHRLLARALTGDGEAIAAAASLPPAAVAPHRLLPALDRLARRVNVEPPAGWRRQRIAAAAHWLWLAETRRAVGEALDRAGVRWLPIKGCDLADRVYEAPEDRPTSDLDLLVAPASFDAARAALEDAGWSSLVPGEAAERYCREEGYAWQARRRGQPLVELHFRLWGLAPEELAGALVEDAVAAPELGAGRRPSLAGAFLLAAVHLWLEPPPRSLLACWDLERLAGHAAAQGDEDGLSEAVVDLARRFDLQLPVALAAAHCRALWPRPAAGAIAGPLLADLRPPERWLATRLARRGADALRLGQLVMARLLAGRRSRSGWRVIRRQLWAHPGVVAQETPAGWSWPRRRLAHVGRQLGWRRL